MLLDFFIYTFLGWYLDNGQCSFPLIRSLHLSFYRYDAVIPSEFGVPKPWYFLCSPRYYTCCRNRKSSSSTGSNVKTPLLEDDVVDVHDNTIEEVGVAQRQLAAGDMKRWVFVCGCPLLC